VADVAGKGVAAALLASSLQATLRALVPTLDDPARLLARTNDQLCAATDDEHFATLFLMLLPADGGPASYVSAGHVPPLVLRADGTASTLRPGGPPVGMIPGASYRVGRIALAPGDTIVVCTDGVTEAADPAGVAFGDVGLVRAAQAAAGAPERMLAAILAAVAAHSHQARDPGDDLTLLVAARTP
jgi:sigma-B regulation protein RsbU (phosphoserine phosphatase)